MTEIIDGQIVQEYEDIERAILGAMMTDNEALEKAFEQRLRKEYFFVPTHQLIYNEIETQSFRLSPKSVIEGLDNKGQLETAGGSEYIGLLSEEGVKHKQNDNKSIEHHIHKLKDRYARKGLLEIARRIYNDVFHSYGNDKADYQAILENVFYFLFNLTEKITNKEIQRINSTLLPVINDIERVLQTRNAVTGIPSGFPSLDKMTAGFQASDYVVISGSPFAGKTSLALSMLAHICFRERRPAAFFSLDMQDTSLTKRMVSLEGEINYRNIFNGFLSPENFFRIAKSIAVMKEAPLYIIDKQNMSLIDICSASKWLSYSRIEIIFIDYLNLINSENTALPVHEQLITVSKFIKGLARELKIPIVALYQSSRNAREDGSDIFNSGNWTEIEREADTLIFLKRENGLEGEDITKAKLSLVKQRNGIKGDAEIDFLPSYLKFRDSLGRDVNRNDPFDYMDWTLLNTNVWRL